MRFDITDLRLFVVVVRSGSITRGAAAMNLALASASQRISGMEATLAVPLLERAARGVHPTQAGTALLRHAEDILFRADRMLGELRGFSAGQRGWVRLLSNTGALLGILPRALRGFLSAHPGIDIEVEEHPSGEIVRLIAEGAAELGIVADVVDPGALHLHRLDEDRLVLVTATMHSLADRGEVGFAEAVREPLIGQGIRPFLWCERDAEEAARFYVSVFDNSHHTHVALRRVHAGTERGSGANSTGRRAMLAAEQTEDQRWAA